jgi:molybdenum cofactor synthesis domain-containing protein
MRIMTGAPIPAGCDAVVMVELTRTVDEGTGVIVEHAAKPGDHLRLPGEDVAAGQEVFPSRTVLGPGHLGVLASVGRGAVVAFPRARVGVLSTGDELVEGGAPLLPGQIRDSNRHTLLALLAQSGCVPVDLGIARDSESAISSAVEGALPICDAVLASGGVSMGDFDYVKVVLDQLSAGSMRWMQVAIRPAKPFAFGVIEGRPVFGLPGNPVSSTVSFELFARPGLRAMMGHDQLDRVHVEAVADEDLRRRPDGKLHLARVVATPGEDGRFHVRFSGGQASHQLSAMALANALALIPDGEGVGAGESVTTMLLGPF